MAYTSIIPVHRLDNSINYIKDKEKTTKPAASAVPVRMRLRICLQLSAGSIKWMEYKGIT